MGMSIDDSTVPSVVILDIDGVLADVRHRLHHLERKPKDWAGFFGHMAQDPVLPEGLALAESFAADGHQIVYVTGRPAEYRDLTLSWLRANRLPTGELIMRRRSDHRPAATIKAEIVREYAQNSTIVAIVDDDPAVVAALRSHALPVRLATWHGLPDHGADPQASDSAHQLLLEVQEEDGAT
jgi:hypothetical protein